jgi:SET domain-containing protein
MPASYLSPKTEVRRSLIHGQGLFAKRPIRKDEIVAIKGGHVLDTRMLARVKSGISCAYIQIEDSFYLGAARPSEVARNKIWLNHSCEPNVGIRGQSTFVAMRRVKPGDELTYDWAMEENHPAITRCACKQVGCRQMLTGQGWKNPALQRKYKGYFSAYLAQKIRRASR